MLPTFALFLVAVAGSQSAVNDKQCQGALERFFNFEYRMKGLDYPQFDGYPTRSELRKSIAKCAVQVVDLMPAFLERRKREFIAQSSKETEPDDWMLVGDWNKIGTCSQDLRWIIARFGSELNAVGTQPESLIHKLDCLKQSEREAALAGKSFFNRVGWKFVNFPDIPDNHWAYEGLSGLKKRGLYIDNTYRRGSWPTPRAKFAQIACDMPSRLPALIANELEEDRINHRQDKAMAHYFAIDLRQYVTRLVKTFSWEVRKLGHDPRQVMKDFDKNKDGLRRLSNAYKSP